MTGIRLTPAQKQALRTVKKHATADIPTSVARALIGKGLAAESSVETSQPIRGMFIHLTAAGHAWRE